MEQPLNRKHLANAKGLGCHDLFTNASHLGVDAAREVPERAVRLALRNGALQGTKGP